MEDHPKQSSSHDDLLSNPEIANFYRMYKDLPTAELMTITQEMQSTENELAAAFIIIDERKKSAGWKAENEPL